MLWNLFNFFTDATTGTTDETTGGNWVTWVIFGALIILCVVMMIVPQRKAKKAQEEMQAKIRVGATIMTAGGIIGEIVSMKEDTITIETSKAGTKIRFLKSAVRSVDVRAADKNAPQTAEESAESK